MNKSGKGIILNFSSCFFYFDVKLEIMNLNFMCGVARSASDLLPAFGLHVKCM